MFEIPVHFSCLPLSCQIIPFQVREYEEKIDRLERTVEQQRHEIDDLKGRVQSLDGTLSAADQRVAGLIVESEQRQISTSQPWFCLGISVWWPEFDTQAKIAPPARFNTFNHILGTQGYCPEYGYCTVSRTNQTVETLIHVHGHYDSV